MSIINHIKEHEILGGFYNKSQFPEVVDDRVASLITNGTGLTWIYDDVGNTLTGNVSGFGASNEPYITIGNTAGLSAERALTGTENQIVITDNGVNSTVVLSLPQSIHTAASPTFAGLTLSGLTQNSVPFAGSGGLISQDNTNFFWNDTTNTFVLGGTQIGNNMSASIRRSSSETTGDNFGMELLNTILASTSGTSFGLRFTANYDADSGTQANIAGIGGAVTISGNGTITELVSNRSGIVSQGATIATVGTAYQFKAGLVAVGASNFTDVIYFGADANATIGAGSVARMTYLSIPSIPIGTIKWGINSALDIQVQDGVKIYFEGTATTKGDTYMVYDNIGTTLDIFVNGVEKWNSITGLVPTVVTLSSGASVATDCSLGNYFRLTAGQSFTLANPTNPVNGQKYIWEIIQDVTGSRVMTLGSKFAFGTDITSATLTTTASKRDFMGVIYNSTTDIFYIISFVKGY